MPVMDGMADHVVVVGSDTITVRLAEELERAGEQTVIVISGPEDPDLVDELEAIGADVISAGRVRERDLITAGIERAKAAVIVDDDDVFVIRVALAVEELNPEVRLVLGMSDPKLGHRLRPVFGEVEILSPGLLAAPTLVAAALASTDLMSFEIGGRLVVAGPRSSVGGTELAVIGDSNAGTLEDTVLPAEGGDVVLGTEVTGRPRSVRQSGMIGALARIFDRRLRLVLIGLVVLIILSTVYFRFVGVDWLEAVYLALTTSTDLGMGDSEEELGVGFRIGAVIIHFFGLVLSSGITAVIVDALISSRLAELSGGVRGRPSDHIVVCGLGRIGSEVAVRLHERGVGVVAVEMNESAIGVPRARRRGIPVVIGPASDEAVLETAGVARAEAVLALTDNEAVNLEIGLVAKQVNESVRVVTRVYHNDLAVRVERRLRLGQTRSVSQLTAPAFASAALGRSTRVIFPIGRWVLIFTEITVADGSEAIGRRSDDLAAAGGSRVLAIKRAGAADWDWEHAAVRLEAGDQLAVAATRDALARMMLLTRQSGRSATPGS